MTTTSRMRSVGSQSLPSVRHAGLVRTASSVVSLKTVVSCLVLLSFVFWFAGHGPYILALGNLSAITAIGAMGLTVLVGTAGLLSLGQAAFLAIGGFAAAFLTTHSDLGFYSALAIGGGVAALIGVIVAVATTRTIGIYLAVGTLALQYVVQIVLSDIEVKFTAATGFQMDPPVVLGMQVLTEKHWWYLLCGCVFLTWLVLRFIIAGKPGRSWKCMKENPVVATSLGISVTRARMAVFALSSCVAGVAGVLHGYYVGTVQIDNYSLHLSIVFLTIVVLGRLGSLVGAVWASAVITALPHVLSSAMRAMGFDVLSYGAGAENVVIGLILAVILLKVPQRVARRMGIWRQS